MRIASDLTNPAWGSQGLIRIVPTLVACYRLGLGIRMGLISGVFPSVSASMENHGRARFLMEKSRGISAYFTRYTPYGIMYLFEQMRRGQEKKGLLSTPTG